MVHAEVRLAWKTRAGHRHQVEGLENEDAVFATDQHPFFDAVLMVADGMGGHPRPREAAEAAVRAAKDVLFDRAALQRASSPSRLLEAAARAAHRAVRGLHTGPSPQQPGTTLSIAVLADGVVHLAHVGDGSVFLMREGQVRTVAGGEDRRAGNRPAQYVGQEAPLEPELAQLMAVEGDRILLCTDGLTRYFSEAGPEALERTLGRQGVEIEVVASQLTSHSRADEYHDDTTVALAEVTALRPEGGRRSGRAATVAEARGTARNAPPVQRAPVAPRRQEPMQEPRAARGGAAFSLLTALLGAAIGAALLGVGYVAGRASRPATTSAAPGAAAPVRRPADPASLKSLPAGNLVLVDELGGRVFSLGTHSGSPPTSPLDLQALKVGTGGRLAPAGRFRLDPTREELTDPQGRKYPVEVDLSRGTVRILRGGSLTVTTRPAGALVTVDGREIGSAPQTIPLPEGKHRVRVLGRSWSSDSEVDLPAGRNLSVTLSAP